MGNIKLKMESKPKKPNTGFFDFCVAQRAEHTGEEKLTAKVLGERWKACDTPTKEHYNVPAKKAIEEYKVELAAWKEANPDAAEEAKSRNKSKAKKASRKEEDEEEEEKPKKPKAKKGDKDEKKPKKAEKAADDKKDAKKNKKSVK